MIARETGSETGLAASALGAATRVARDEPGEDACEDLELLAAELLEEALLNGGEMAGLRLAGQLEAGRGEVRFDSAGILGRRSPLDQLARLERVDDPRDPAQAETGRVGKRREAHGAVIRRGQPAKAL